MHRPIPVHRSIAGAAWACLLPVAALLGGCGGGDGAPAAPVSPDRTGSSSGEVNEIARGAFEELVRVRTRCGFGGLSRNALLDAAEQGHADYVAKNTADSLGTLQLLSHYQDSTRPYYTAYGPGDRATLAGYDWRGVAEIVSGSSSVRSTSLGPLYAPTAAVGAAMMKDLIATVYHLIGATLEYRDVGIGASLQGWSQAGGLRGQSLVVGATLGLAAGAPLQRLGSGNVASYPCAGIDDAKPDFAPAVESPNPFPAITDRNIQMGTPIYFKSDKGQLLALSSFTLTRVSSGTAVEVQALTQASDPQRLLGAHEAFFVPSQALAENETYRVSASGTVGLASFSTVFTFATGQAR